MPELRLLFLQMIVVLLAARLMSHLLRFIGQPGVVGEMAAGILLGPSLLGKISPAAMNIIFPPNRIASLYTLSQVGLVLFMFVVGLEVQPSMIRRAAKSAVLTSFASIAAPFLCGSVLAWQLYPRFGSGSRLAFVLFMGAAMSITAFPVLARILTDRNLMHTRAGVFSVSCAAVNDAAAWCLLAVIAVVARGGQSVKLIPQFGLLGLYVFIMLFVVRPLLRRIFPPHAPVTLPKFGAAMIFLLASAGIAEALSVHALFGAFLSGLVMPRGGKLEPELRGRVESLTVTLLLPLFFAWNGLRTSIGLLEGADAWLLCALITLIAVASKLVVSAGCARFSGMGWRDSLAVGILVNTRGLVELVILNAGLDLHVLSPAMFSMMVIMALATTVMTTPLVIWVRPSGVLMPEESHVLV